MKSLKKTSFIICLFTALTLVYVGCEKGSTSDLSGTYTLKASETLNLSKGGDRAVLTVEDLKDSRCPINALCAWAGYASGKFKFKDNFRTQTIELCIGGSCSVDAKPTEQKITLNGVVYSLEFTELIPFPTSPNYNSVAIAMATIVLKRK
ncbi:hypothetical protein GM921_08310 [Pedobacter sp. LMG 31464]|uniref:Uncharacterized protein n=1 Tax=Pedobacter planticolens TaxID=2679964 RepID=A0A923IWR4_9SPHI|nr:hypothetical protein [Pedobacter planticolens]MBB2145482.1 hypothetical protein [Pedobacter planticolens]